MGTRDQHGLNPGFDALGSLFRHTEKFDIAAHLSRITDICLCNFRDTFRINVVKGHSGMKSDRSQDRDLSGSVQTLDIGRGICLRIAKLRSQSQGLLKLHALLRHFRQDKVCRSVDDTHNLRNMISGQALL